jgi:hypothetical protein
MKKMNTQTEQWKAVAECNGEYQVSNLGRVKSLKHGKERILKPRRTSTGYLQTELFIKGNRKIWALHRLVALAFIDNPENKPQVNHIDGNKLNNHIDNLEWATAKENMQHAWDTGLFDICRLATIEYHSKPVIDCTTRKKYASLKLACIDINEPYNRHKLRTFRNSPLQRFFYV